MPSAFKGDESGGFWHAALSAIQLRDHEIYGGGVEGGIFAVDAAKVIILLDHANEAETDILRNFETIVCELLWDHVIIADDDVRTMGLKPLAQALRVVFTIHIRRHPLSVALTTGPELIGSLVFVAIDKEILADADDTGTDVALGLKILKGQTHVEIVIGRSAMELGFPAMVRALCEGVVLEVQREGLIFVSARGDDEPLNVASGEDLSESRAIHAWLGDPDLIDPVALCRRPRYDGIVEALKMCVMQSLPLGAKSGEQADNGALYGGPAPADVAHVGGSVCVFLVAHFVGNFPNASSSRSGDFWGML